MLIIFLNFAKNIEMSRKKKALPLLENVTITDIAAEGKALAKVDNMVIFIPFGVPGDIVDIQIKKKKHNYCEAEIAAFRKYSEVRIVPKCEHFGVCGGCKWQNIPYEIQLNAKQKQVESQLKHIGKFELPELSPIMGSEHIWEYRNKLEFGCSNKRWLTHSEIANPELVISDHNAIGFHITGAFDKILPIEKCHLMDAAHNQVRNSIRDYALNNSISFFDLRAQVGLLRDIIIRNSDTGEWMIIVQFCMTNKEDSDKAMGLLDYLSKTFPFLTSILYVNNLKCNDTIYDQDVMVFKGKDHIYEKLGNLKFKVGAKSFYQTNTAQAYHLYEVARSFASLTGKELVYDLYTGTGTIANFVASQAAHVIGIEYVPEAIEDAKINSEINHIENTTFYAGDMKDILTDDFIKKHGRPDVIITDPPRAGMHKDVIDTILNAAPKTIVYVSCNPATQARDVALLDVAYRVVKIQPVDMFPHTPHVENVIKLERK